MFTIYVLTKEMLTKMPISDVILPKLTNKRFVERANINAILINSDNDIREKFHDFSKILDFLTEVDLEFVILKAQPLITHLGNDIDLLMHMDQVKHFIRKLEKKFRILRIELHEGTRRGFKATIHLGNMKLNQIEVYTYVGWYEYVFLPIEQVIKSYNLAKLILPNGAMYHLPLPSNFHSLAIDALHVMFGNRYISLGDLAKLLSYPPNVDYPDYTVNGMLRTGNIIALFIKSLKEVLPEVLSKGYSYIPLRYILTLSSLASISNMFHNKELNIKAYWWEFRRVLNVAYRRWFNLGH